MDETSRPGAEGAATEGHEPGPNPLDDPRLTVLGLLAETFAGLAGKLNEQLSGHALGGLEFEVLLRLARSPGSFLRMTDLAAQTGMSSSGITRVIDRLASDGSVRRESCATDRRTTYAVATDLGRSRLEAALPEHIAIIEQWLVGPLSDRQLDGLVEALRVVRDGVRPCATAGSAQPSQTARPSLS